MKNDKGQKMTMTSSDGRKVTVRLEVNPKAKRLILRLDPRAREGVAIAPTRRMLPEAASFAADRIDWLAQHLDAIQTSLALADGAIIPLRGEQVRITLNGTGRIARMIASADMDDLPLLSVPGAPETLAARVTRFLKKEAKADLTDAVDRYTAALGVKYKRISVKDTRSRWGSCTSDGSLSFSWRLIFAPPHILDYVAAHECAHLLEMNHSDRFWAHVARIDPDWKRHRRWLRSDGQELHAIG